MSEKEHKALDKRDLDHDVAESHGNEIEQTKRGFARLVAPQGQRQNQKYEHRNDRDDEHQQQNTKVYFPVDPLAQSFFSKNLAGLEREEEEWRVIVHRRDVVGVAPGKGVRIIAGNQFGERIVPGL